MTTKTRLKLTVIAALFLGGITIMATIMKMEVVATTSIAGIMTILSAYIWAQTKRPSRYEFSDKNIEQPSQQDDSTLRVRSSVFPDSYQANRNAPKSEQGK
jgi:hypothetical protein